MPRRKKNRQEAIPHVQDEQQDLREYAAEAEQVELMTNHPGWQIVKSDFLRYKTELAEKLPYLTPGTDSFNESRVTFIAVDKLMKMIEDYAENKKRTLELLYKIDNPKTEMILDVDNR